MIGRHCIKTWSSTQGPLALSSAEAEYYSMVECVLKAKGIQGMMEELGMNFGNGEMILGTDSSAAKSFVARRGVGRMRHISQNSQARQPVCDQHSLHQTDTLTLDGYYVQNRILLQKICARQTINTHNFKTCWNTYSMEIGKKCGTCNTNPVTF